MGTSDQLEAIETASVDALRYLQLKRLKAALRRAYGVEFYRNRCEAANVHPDDLRDFSDLVSFPMTTKQDLRQSYPFGMFAVPTDKIVRIHASSGTTGKPTIVGYTKGDIDTWSKLMARSIRAAGGRASDRIHVAYGYGLFTGGLGAHYGGERMGAMVIPASGGLTMRQVQLIVDLRPDIIMVTPSYLLAIIDEFERQGLEPRECSLRLAMLGAEPWTEKMRAEIEVRLELDALDLYGLSEIMGGGVAQECIETKDGLTIWEDHFYPELIDPSTNTPVADGETGELLLTTLTREGMPLIRYRTHDLTRLLPGTARPMRRLERMKGRSDDMVVIRGVNVFPSQIETVLMLEGTLAPHYQLELTRNGRLDELSVKVELKTALAGTLGPDTIGDISNRVQDMIKSYVGISTSVAVVEPRTIPRSEGKAKRIIDLRQLT
ncbi:phenylacetate--CoA ligase PaaK [Rhizobium laguerreae]|uniref:phenylacetate--CoA ligase PaaK n=1 Tax=Rhizobium laguerreae TaxID=1076926 RepID=UPI001C8FCC6F|nr:phenylacetate--CoA ligase PaaK [Rhizobium laguerreae]MBY3203455.1 phenylacetate--CoA ligase [Rhizobium laguerreae]